jgi:hypothetical protein
MNTNSQNCDNPYASQSVFAGGLCTDPKNPKGLVPICFKPDDSVIPVPAPENAPPGSSCLWAQYKLNTASGICMGTYDPLVGNLMDECSFNLFNTSYNPNNDLRSSITENFGNMKVNYEYKKSTNSKCKSKY